MSIGIGISTYNDFEMTGRLIESIKRLTQGEYKLVVIDDGTKNNEIINTLRSICNSNNAELRTNTQNRGIPYTWNRIVEALNTDIVVIFNNDIIVTDPSWLKHIEYFLTNNNMIGGVGFPLIQAGPGQDNYDEKAWGDRPGHVGSAVGCSFGFKKEAWEKVKNPDGSTGFWEDLISFHEETSFGFKLAELGYYSYMMNWPPMIHAGGQTFSKNLELIERPVDWSKWNKDEYIQTIQKSTVYPNSWKNDHIIWKNRDGVDVVDRMAFSRYMFAKEWNVLDAYDAPQIPIHRKVIDGMPQRKVKWLDKELKGRGGG